MFPKSGISLWAKKNNNGDSMMWLPLQQHMIDTMNVSGLLWEHWLSDHQRTVIIESSSCESEDVAKNLVKFLGAVHDIGKATPSFQSKKSSFINTIDIDELLLEKLEKSGFVGISQKDFKYLNKTHHSIASQALLLKYGVNYDVISIVGGHHGKPPDSKSEILEQIISYPTNYYQNEKMDDKVHRKWEQCQFEIFNWILSQVDFVSVEDIPIIQKPAQVILGGLLIMADWIASNEVFFPLIEIENDGLKIDKKRRIQNGWSSWFKTFSWSPSQVDDLGSFFLHRFGFNPRAIQYSFLSAVKDSNSPGIYILEAPMGIGKTEAALGAAELISANLGQGGVFFGLPTQATSNGIFPRIESWLEKISEEDDEFRSIQLVHGKAQLNENFMSISRNVDFDGDYQSGVMTNEWFTGRKTAVLDDFVVGTVDQFLLLALKQKHLALRHLGFSKKTVIIDEIHAYDTYMGQFLSRAIYWMGVYGVPVILLSATLPMQRRAELIEAYIRGSGKKLKNISKPVDWEKTESYPLITYFSDSSINQLISFGDFENKEVSVHRITDEELFSILEDKLSDGGIAGIVVNTVKRAQDLAEAMSMKFGEELVEVLHSSFISDQRIKNEESLIKMIGKNATRPYKKIIIGTQVIEQSLDIDFDLLFSDLAPMDLLIQRLGRLHRHNIYNRPEKLKDPMYFILGTDANYNFSEGSSYVYGEYLLFRTQYFLPDKLNIPSDISKLVQLVYQESDIEINSEFMEKYSDAKMRMSILLKDKSSKAQAFLLDKLIPSSNPKDDNLYGWLKSSMVGNDQKGLAQVRDSLNSIEVILLKKCGSGYSFIDGDKDLSGKESDYKVSKAIANQTINLPSIFSKPFLVDSTIDLLERDNIRRLSSWQSNSWLKGALGIILDENNSYSLGDWTLTYDLKYGFKYKKEVEHE